MARRKPGTVRRTSGIIRFARDENGKVSIVSILAVMAIFGMIGLVANTGRVTREKIELQTAADSAATTTTLWLARSMNAVTTANHLMGEATAVLVLLDGLGGPDFPISPPVSTPQGIRYYKLLKDLRGKAPASQMNMKVAWLRTIDMKLVPAVVDALTADEGRTEVGAALYDAKMTLKFVAATCLKMKEFMNTLQLFVPLLRVSGYGKPVAEAIEWAGLAVHSAATPILGLALKEWQVLRGIEKVLITVGPPIRSMLLEVVLPGLSRYGDSVVGTTGRPGSVNRAIRRSLDALEQEHKLASLEMVPPVDELRLPLEREPEAGAAGGEQPHRGWTGNYETGGMRTLRRVYEVAISGVKLAIQAVELTMRLAIMAAEAAGALVDGATGGNAEGLREEIRKVRREIDKLSEKLLASTALPDPPGKDGFEDNPARDEERLPAFDWEAERRSQWARATHPYVDDYRAAVIRWFRDQVSWSNAATYLVNWTNRFTLVRAYQLRGDPERTHMYVLREMNPAEKGREPWVADARAAADLFAVVAVATREPAAVWLAPWVFTAAGGRPAAVAGGLVYNANGNRVLVSGPSATQPDTGWDTLNWQPPVEAPEWGGGSPTIRAGDAWAVFTSSQPSGPKARVRLNWQGKLVPVDRGLLGRATGDEAGFIRRHERLLEH